MGGQVVKKFMISLAAALPLLGGVAVTEAAGSGWSPNTGTNATQAMVVGTVVSVDATAGTFVANAFVVPPFGGEHGSAGGDGPGFGGFGFFPGGFGHDGTGTTTTTTSTTTTPTAPTATQVTITTNKSTTITLGHSTATLSQLAVGDRFRALFTGAPTDAIGTLVASAALSVNAAAAPKQHQLYAFVGTVKSTDTTAGTVTVDVTAGIPSSLLAAGTDATFTVGTSTLVIGGSSTSGLGFSTGSLSNVSTGDIVAGGLIGDAGETAAQVQAAPLMLLLDFPAGSSSSSSSSSSSIRASALKRAEALLGVTTSTTKKSKKSKKSHTHSRKHESTKH
jgi:hypothetical protein